MSVSQNSQSETQATPLAAAPHPALVRALHRMLRPLVRMLLAHQITYPFLTNLLKTIFVEVAEREFSLPDRRQTVSRVSLLTGIHRKDVKRLRQGAPESAAVPAAVSLGAQLVARWTGVAEFLQEDGHPKALPRQSESGVSFQRLVESVSKDIRPRVVLDEWLRLGVARIEPVNDQELVRLNVDAFVPASGFDEKAFYFGRNLRDHIATAASNLAGVDPSRLERSVYYDDLTADSVRELAELSEDRAMDALQAVNRRALALQASDAGKPDATSRMNFGVYFSDDGGDEGAGVDPSGDSSVPNESGSRPDG